MASGISNVVFMKSCSHIYGSESTAVLPKISQKSFGKALLVAGASNNPIETLAGLVATPRR
jgi:hypothetical protein